jgi:hypothetical protein
LSREQGSQFLGSPLGLSVRVLYTSSDWGDHDLSSFGRGLPTLGLSFFFLPAIALPRRTPTPGSWCDPLSLPGCVATFLGGIYTIFFAGLPLASGTEFEDDLPVEDLAGWEFGGFSVGQWALRHIDALSLLGAPSVGVKLLYGRNEPGSDEADAPAAGAGGETASSEKREYREPEDQRDPGGRQSNGHWAVGLHELASAFVGIWGTGSGGSTGSEGPGDTGGSPAPDER